MTAIRDHHPACTTTAPTGSVSGAAWHFELIALARQSHSGHGFLTRALGVIGRAFSSPYARIYFRHNAEVFREEVHSGSTSPTFWRGPTDELLTDAMARGVSRARLLSARGAPLQIAILTAPLFDATGIVCGAVAVVVQSAPADARQHLMLLESLAMLASQLQSDRGHAARATGAPPAAGATMASTQSLARAAACESETELAFSITNGLRNKFGFEQVVLARVRGLHADILSISGLDEVKPRSPGVQCIRAAMEECLDLGVTVAVRGGGDCLPEGTRPRLHAQWHDAARGASVASLPLRFCEQVVAILSVRHSGNEELTAEGLAKLHQTVEPLAPALVLLRKAQRGLPTHAIDALRSTWQWLRSRGGVGRKVLLAAVVAAAAWIAFGTLPFRPTVPCVLQPAEIRQLSCPFDAVLASVQVAAGDRVRAGDVLARLDRRELDTQHSELAAELEVHRQERLRALAAGAPVEARLAEANETLARTRLALVEARLAQTEILAPFDGVIVAGDQRRQVGAALAQGTTLFEIAPLDRWTVELAVPENVVAFVHAGLAGEFVSTGRPEDTRMLAIGRVRPAAEIRGQRNVYVAEAELRAEGDWLRPGMEGVVRIRAEHRPVWWLTLRPILDYLRLRFWL